MIRCGCDIMVIWLDLGKFGKYLIVGFVVSNLVLIN